MSADPTHLTREAAVTYCHGRGVTTVTASQLARHAVNGTGPEYKRFGHYAYYLPSDLDAWINTMMKPVTKGRSAPRTAA